MEYLGVLGGIASMFLLACLSPGPVWMVITSTSIAVSRRAGVLTGLGVAGATLTWATVAMLGLGVLLAQLAWLSAAIRLAGAAYLVWLGVKLIAGARRPTPSMGALPAMPHRASAALRCGYCTSMTNPKAAAFFGSIFVVMLPDHAPFWVYLLAVVQLAALSAAWHCGLAVVFSAPSVQAGYRKIKARIDVVIGAVLIALGCRLALSR
jgi:threonine/homoserine/homoserine lactone efflux protein